MEQKKKNFDRQVKCIWGESLILMPMSISHQYIFFGIGTVAQIRKGEEYDLVQILPKPCFKKEVVHLRDIIVAGNHPRRQLLTLKCGQIAMFYGRAFLKWKDVQSRDGTIKRINKWHFMAFGVQGWYVPTMFDIRKAEKENEIEEYDELDITQKEFLDNILDHIEKTLAETNGDKNEE